MKLKNPRAITLVLVGYSILQIVLFTTLQTTSSSLFFYHELSLFQISIICESILLLESLLAIIVIVTNSLSKIYKTVSYLFVLIRLVSVAYIYLADYQLINKEIGHNLELFSIIIGCIQIVIVYSQIKMIKNVQSIQI